MTLGLACNVDGTHKLKPLVVHKSQKPRCFGKAFKPNDICYWYSNKSAWVTTEVFKDVVKQWNKEFALKDRKYVSGNPVSHDLRSPR
jgi:hypothetical protein